ncbi:hypothetical protein nvc2_016 [Namao virus]|nr:hypothetical protein nvc2_016 [Namao virus]
MLVGLIIIILLMIIIANMIYRYKQSKLNEVKVESIFIHPCECNPPPVVDIKPNNNLYVYQETKCKYDDCINRMLHYIDNNIDFDSSFLYECQNCNPKKFTTGVTLEKLSKTITVKTPDKINLMSNYVNNGDTNWIECTTPNKCKELIKIKT